MSIPLPDADVEDLTGVQTITDEGDDNKVPHLDLDKDNNNDNDNDSVTKVALLDSLNEADELDDAMEEIAMD